VGVATDGSGGIRERTGPIDSEASMDGGEMPEKHSRARLDLHFHVRPVLVRWIVSVICLFLTVLVVPHVYYQGDYPVLSWLIISAVFALLTTFVKPLVQLLLLPLIFVSYGLVIVLINTLIIWFLAVIFPARFHVDHLLWALVAGLVSGLLIGLLENLFGLTPPIVQGGPERLKAEMAKAKSGRVEEQLLDAAGRSKKKIKHHRERHHHDDAGPERPGEERS
jgi:putative membrane protein